MESAAVACHTFPCHQNGAKSICGTEGPISRFSERIVFQRAGLLALPRLRRLSISQRPNQRKRSASSATTAGHTLLETTPSINVEGIVAEMPELLALSSDLDWKQSVAELREQALGVLTAQGKREMDLERLGRAMHDMLHDCMFDSVLNPLALRGNQDLQDDMGVLIRVEELRREAALQATEVLAHDVDSSFDWETEVADLRRCIAKQERVDIEKIVWNSWEPAREGMGKDVENLYYEALGSQPLDDSYLLELMSDNREKSVELVNKTMELSGTWWTFGLAMAGLFGLQAMDAIAADDSITSAVTAAGTDASGWVAPTLLALPLIYYVLFTSQCEKVKSYSKLADRMFGFAAMAIVGKIVLIAAVGVQMY